MKQVSIVLLSVLLLNVFPVAVSGKSVSDPWDEYDYSVRNGSTITYHWLYNYEGEFTKLSLSLSFNRGWQHMQNVYKTKGHSEGNFYQQFVNGDPFEEDAKVVAAELEAIAKANHYSKAKVALSFVQSIPHDKDNPNYQRYAIECLIDGEGDCSDKSCLLMAILAYMGYETIQLGFPGHLAVGVMENTSVAIFSGTWYNYRGFRFYFAETNGRGYDIGDPGWHPGARAEISKGYIREGSIGGTHYYAKCSRCNGKGWTHGGEVPCIACSGRGYN